MNPPERDELAQRRMSIEQAARTAERTGDTTHLVEHWDRTRAALLHDCIRALLNDPPACVSSESRLRLLHTAQCLQRDLDRTDTR